MGQERFGLAVSADCEVEVVGLSLKELQKAVDGLIEPIDITEGLTMWVNEEFLFRNEPEPNVVASAFFSAVGGTYAVQGTVVFTGGTDAQGETLALSKEDEQAIRQFASVGQSLREMA